MTADHSAEFRRCLLECDVRGIIAVHKYVFPHLPAPSSEKEALVSLHLARTEALSIPAHMRLYSKRWLNERGFGSFMPDNRRELN